MKPEERKWLEFAETDYSVAKYLNNNYYPKPLEIICYHCQQAAEKAIKAVILTYGAQGGMPKKHNLSLLLEQIKNVVEIPERYYEYADVLTPYGIVARYPNELYLEEYNAVKALQCAEEILKWAENVLKLKQESKGD